MPFVSACDEQLDEDYPNLCPTRPNAAALGSTADYHQSLLDQHHDSGSNSGRKHDLADVRHDGDSPPKCRRSARWEKSRHGQSNGSRFRHPGLTREDLEEFESLPLAIRRKYFSTLERLRLAQTSVLNASSHKHTRSNNVGCDFHAHRGVRFNQVALSGKKYQRPTTSPTDQSHPLPPDSLSLARLPAKIREKHLTREEQLLLAKQLRESVILDAADEAIYRIGRRLTRQPFAPTSPSFREPRAEASGMDKELCNSEETRDDLHDCFRWLDEDEDLDLSLALEGSSHVPSGEFTVPRKERMPSFRRHLSSSKIHIGSRISCDSSRPVTKDAVSIPPSPALSNFTSFPQQTRRRSRAFSLITPKHTAHDSIASIDPAAAHYQDPEARLKLRVYLSSPQKFDEAIEFGFPSHDVFPAESDQEHQRSAQYGPQSPSEESEHLKTFLADDRSSVYSEDMSIPDPDSPQTPHTFDQPPLRALPTASRDDSQGKVLEGYAQVPVASREMTLRMTLTRPDLRACEEQIYGWSHTAYRPSSKLPRSSPFRDDLSSTTHLKPRHKDSLDRIFADIDQDLDSQSAHGGVMKRLWKRVRRG